MKNLIYLFLIFSVISSCSNMQSDVDKACTLTTKTMEMMPEVLQLSMKASFGDEESKNEAQSELDNLQSEIEKMAEELEDIKDKYDEEEFQASFLESCEAAKKLLEMGEALEGFSEQLE